MTLRGYDWLQSYSWNYANAPDPVDTAQPPVPGAWTYATLPAPSPLAIAAGPLLNGRWILYYASLGFDILTYKTVRSRFRPAYEMPNLQPVRVDSLADSNSPLPATSIMTSSWAVSFGMPSMDPEIWRADIQTTRRKLPKHKILSVSVVATPEPSWSLQDIARDFAQCAQWAVESGADCVEANFSCPNVASADGQLYHHPSAAARVASEIRNAIGRTPLLLKIGHVTDRQLARALCQSLAPHATALVMVNCISAQVLDTTGQPLFQGERRGIAGDAIREAATRQIQLFADQKRDTELGLIGVGGISTAAHVQQFLAAGCHAVQLATAAMLDPSLALSLRQAYRCPEN